MAKRKSEKDHDTLVDKKAKSLKLLNFNNIKASRIPEYEEPDPIPRIDDNGNHIPDLTADKGSFYIYEVETDDSIYDEHTKSQWTSFSKYAQDNNNIFVIIVPVDSQSKARKRCDELDIQAIIEPMG